MRFEIYLGWQKFWYMGHVHTVCICSQAVGFPTLSYDSDVDESYLSSHVESQALQVRVIWIFFKSSRVMTWSSRVRVESWLGRVESESSHKICRVTSLPTRVNVKSNEIKHCHYFFFFFIFFVLWRKMKWKFLFFQMKFCFCTTSLRQMQLNIVRMTMTSRSLNIMRSEFLKQKKG